MNLSYDQMLFILRTTASIICAMCLLFMVLYGFGSNWRQTRAGMAVMTLTGAVFLAWGLTLLLSFLTITTLWKIFAIQLFAHAATIGALGYLLYALLYNQRLDRIERKRVLTEESTRD